MVTCNNCYHYEACKKIFQIAFKDFTNYIFVKGCELYKSTADVAEVKHGKWRKQGNEKECSLCKFIYYSNNDDFTYCPNCGAKNGWKG